MKIAIIGGGITGLTAAYKLTKSDHEVTVFEKDPYLGGLAYGFKKPDWDWSLEAFYHHIFTNDIYIIKLAREIGLENDLIFKRPITATLTPNHKRCDIYQLDSPLSLLRFDRIPLIDRVRTGIMLGFFKLNPFWQPLEHVTAIKIIKLLGGNEGWRTIWEPLMEGKFNGFKDEIAASWFWARIKKRTPVLGYFRGGFQTFINKLEQKIRLQGGIIHTDFSIDAINFKGSKFKVITSNSFKNSQLYKNKMVDQFVFDKILLTTPSPIALKLISSLITNNVTMKSHFAPNESELRGTRHWSSQISNIPHLHAQILILETDKPIIKDVYWLNITDRSFPFLAVVSHTNFMDKNHYGGRHITYIGNYLPDKHPYLSMDKNALYKIFLPYLKKINPDFNYQLSTINYQLFTGPFAQPIHQLRYSKRAPKITTPLNNVYLSNMDSIYPWDRGTNYAVELGLKSADKIMT